MFFASLFRRHKHVEAAHSLYGAAVTRAREPAFYRHFGVPDTLDGRFEMICLHVFLILRRLKESEGGNGDNALSQAVFDLMFADMDQNLRELGVGDLSVGRRVKTMAQAFYGRVAAYERGLSVAEDDVLSEAVARNVYESAAPGAPALARYLRDSTAAMALVPAEALLRGEVRFGTLPEVYSTEAAP